MKNIIERLKQSKAEYDSAEKTDAIEDGKQYFDEIAEYSELLELEALYERRHEIADDNLGTEIEGIAQAYGADESPWKKENASPGYIAQWLETVVAAFREVKDQL